MKNYKCAMQHDSGSIAPTIYLTASSEKDAFSQFKSRTRLSAFDSWTPLVSEYRAKK